VLQSSAKTKENLPSFKPTFTALCAGKSGCKAQSKMLPSHITLGALMWKHHVLLTFAFWNSLLLLMLLELLLMKGFYTLLLLMMMMMTLATRKGLLNVQIRHQPPKSHGCAQMVENASDMKDGKLIGQGVLTVLWSI
jgi:hypothetical protein